MMNTKKTHVNFLSPDYFPGLIPLIYAYLDHIQCDSVTMERMTKYLDFIEKRATGQLLTPATWIRKFIRNHEDYKFDSVVTDSIAYVFSFISRLSQRFLSFNMTSL